MPPISAPCRLQILNASQPTRPWRNCAEKRRCIACGHTFRGTAVTIRVGARRKPVVGCPGCGSAPDLWVHPGNPLTDADIWAEWDAAMVRSSEVEAMADEEGLSIGMRTG